MSKYTYPCLPWTKYNNNVGKFLDPAYYTAIGSEHPGADINANTGGNSDLGHPVYCIADGIVEVNKFFPAWGNVVLVYHPGPKIWSQYAHLQDVYVRQGQELKVKDKVGTIGRGAQNRYIAHLHFEIRYKKVPADYWTSAYLPDRVKARADIKSKYVDPIKFLEKMQATKV